VARNRKRAKERRARRPGNGSEPQPGVATARLDAPDPIEHAAPDVELAEAQLALGRPDLQGDTELESVQDASGEAEREPVEDASGDDEPAPVEDAVGDAEPAPFEDASGDAEAEGLVDPEFAPGPQIPGVMPGLVHVEAGGDDDAELLPAETVSTVPAHRRGRPGNRLVNFIQGSWRELQRVQWPDRRQVMQATGVVIGFVIVAGVFLGVADLLAGKLVTYILK
jgi:preprotein translocase subunit SecE